jgi:ElaB/YqjD/DUF883 family membrane-anchored ribosome-binding protein
MSRMNEGTQGVGQTAANLKDAAGQVGQNLRDLGGQVKEQASAKYNELRDQATQYYAEGRDRARQWEQSFEEYVQEQPLKAVLLAAGAGLILGMIWKRR